jgi:hypothetical protein
MLIIDPQTTDVGALGPLFKIVGKCFGNVDGVVAATSEEHPQFLRLVAEASLGHLRGAPPPPW